MWQTFWHQYEVTIHNNTDIGKVDQFNYLKSYMSGPASNVIAGLTLTEANYENAIELLKSRFGHKDLVINAHMSKLLNLSPLKRSQNVAELRKL